MSRSILLAAVGILALGLGSVLLIAGSMNAPVPAGAEAAPAPSQAAPPSPVAAVGGTDGRPSDVPERKPPPPGEAEEAWAPEEPAPSNAPWEAIAPVSRFTALGAIGAGVRMALSELHERHLQECFEGPDDLRLRGVAEEEAGQTRDPTPVLILQLETLGGSVRIVDAAVEERGNASDRLLACALGGLRGATLAVPQARPGARHRLRYRLAQSSRPDAPW
jgi:hypothetical protein